MKTPSAPTACRIHRTTLSIAHGNRQLRSSHYPNLHSATVRIAHKLLSVLVCVLHPQNSFISRFFTVFTFVSPCIHDFHAQKISARPATAGLTFLSEVPDLTLFNPFYPRPLARSQFQDSTSFHEKVPVIPHIPLNSTYAVPRKVNSTFSTQVPDFFAFLRSSRATAPLCNSTLITKNSKLAPQRASQVPAMANSDRFSSKSSCSFLAIRGSISTLLTMFWRTIILLWFCTPLL